MPSEHILIIAEDRHVGIENNLHPSIGGLGYSSRNDDAIRLLGYIQSQGLIIVNACSKSTENVLFTTVGRTPKLTACFSTVAKEAGAGCQGDSVRNHSIRDERIIRFVVRYSAILGHSSVGPSKH